MRSLRLRVLALVLLPILPLLALTAAEGVNERRDAAREGKRTALRLAQAVAENQEQLITEARQLLTTVAKDPRVRSGEPTACNLYLADILHRWPRYANLGLIGRSGIVRCSALPSAKNVDASDRLYFRQAVSTREFAVGEYQIGRITGKASLNFGYPLLDSSGNVTNVVFAALDLGWLNVLARDANLAPGTSLLVVDHKGTILARHPDPARWLGRSARSEPTVRTVLRGEQGTAETSGLDGVERFYGFTPLPHATSATPVYVSAGLERSRILSSARNELEWDLGVVGILAVLSVLVGWLGGSLLVARPIERRSRELKAREAALAGFGASLAAVGRERLPSTLLTGIADVAEADVGALYLADGPGGELFLAASRGVAATSLASRLQPGEGRAGRALAELRPLTVEESELRLPALGSELVVRHELDLPLLHDGGGVGVVVLGRTSNGAFSVDEVELLTLLGREAGTALATPRG